MGDACYEVPPFTGGHQCIEDNGHEGSHQCGCGEKWGNDA